MPTVVSKFAVVARGIGRPDHSQEIASGITRLGARRKTNQQFKIFGALFSDIASLYPWVLPALTSGASAHLVDQETGLATPYTFGAGYTFSLLARVIALSQDYRWDIYMDSQLVVGGALEGGIPFDREEMLKFSSALIDPTASSPHEIDMVFTNLGTANLYGGITGFCVVEAIGTPEFPTTKTTRCPFCGNEEVKPVTATEIICSACGKLYRVYDLTRYKGG
ncbi:hypothetical protein ES704_03490 [subsurface metagenome]|jgi:ribosomal protein L37AE/L43A